MIENPDAVTLSCNLHTVQNAHVDEAYTFVSPNCRWVVRSEDKDRLSVFNAKTGRRIASFRMERSAAIHWLKDGQTLLINYYSGSNGSRPMLLRLDEKSGFTDLSKVMFPAVTKRLRIHHDDVLHAYFTFFSEDEANLKVSVAIDYAIYKHRLNSPAEGRCLIYQVNKRVPVRYKLISVSDLTDDNPCPTNPEEHW